MDQWPPALLPGLIAAALAALSWWADRRRARRANLDAVGFMPWTGVYFWSLLTACILLGLSAREWIAG